MTLYLGKIKCGERIPSVRELALANRVNPNTMQRALIELENLGLVYTERTNGKFVTTDQLLVNKYRKEMADELTKKYLDGMKNIGVGKEEIYEYFIKNGGSEL